MTQKILQFIGKGQITIPQAWRALLGFNKNGVKATLQGSKIIIETITSEGEKKWATEHVLLNTLPRADQNLLKEGRKAYKLGKKKKFLTAAEFFKI